MKNTKNKWAVSLRLLAIIAIGAVIGFSIASCADPEPELSYLSGEIKIEPENNVYVGDELSAVYTGSEAVNYQWQKDYRDIDGATSTTYTPTEAGNYYTVVVSLEGYYGKTSNSVSVYAYSDFEGSITISPAGPVTTRTLLTATYSGPDSYMTYTYLWKKDGIALERNPNSSFNPNQWYPEEAGSYTVTVSLPGYNGLTSAPVNVVDPTPWTAIDDDTFIEDNLNAIAYGAGKFVVGGSRSKMLTSSDGENWTNLTVFEINPINTITYAGSKFVAIIGGSGVATSSDGTTWTSGSGIGNSRAIAYGDSKYVAVGYNSVSYSSDGTSWTQLTYSSGGESPPPAPFWYQRTIYGIAYGDSKFVAGGFNGKMATSTNGENWTDVTTTTFGGFAIYSIAYGAGKFVAVGEGSRMATSSDGTSWTAVANNPFDYGGDYYKSLRHINTIIFANNMFVAGCDDGAIATSPDGTTWTLKTKSALDTKYTPVRAIAYGADKFVAVGASGDGYYEAYYGGKMAYWKP